VASGIIVCAASLGTVMTFNPTGVGGPALSAHATKARKAIDLAKLEHLMT